MNRNLPSHIHCVVLVFAAWRSPPLKALTPEDQTLVKLVSVRSLGFTGDVTDISS